MIAEYVKHVGMLVIVQMGVHVVVDNVNAIVVNTIHMKLITHNAIIRI